MTLPARIFSLSFSILLSFWREKKGSFPSFFLLFSFLGEEMERIYYFSFFSSFPFSFVSFLLLSTLFSSFGVGNEREMENVFFFFSFLLNSFLWKRGRGATGKNRRKFCLFFFLIFSIFSFFSAFWFSVFGEKMMGNGERWENRKDYPKHANQLLQEQILFQQNKFILSLAKSFSVC